MSPFVPARITDAEIRRTAQDFAHLGVTEAELHAWLVGEQIFRNDTYQVNVRKLGKPAAMAHLSIRRLDRAPIHDWRDLQAIKNALIGPECEAVELYPAESRRVDAANQFHLWCVLDPAFRFPFGFTERLVMDGHLGKAKQRPFAQGESP